MSDLGLYIHVPFCRHACPYCDFYKIELRAHPARTRLEFTDDLALELDLLLAAFPGLSATPLRTIYFGGGTPSTLSPPGVARLIATIRDRLPSADALEITLEANPENMTPRRCEAWREAGITRLSMGAQSFAEQDLVLLERLHGSPTISRAVENARAAGFDNISLDLMFALPGQSLEAWLLNLQRAVELAPNHLSFYGLTWHEGTPFTQQLEAGILAESPEVLQAEMYHAGVEFLDAAGFEHYEISNFARPGFRSTHNQRYWTRADVVGLGPGAHSNLALRRWRNPDDLEAWRTAIRRGDLAIIDVADLDAATNLGEALFTKLRRREGIDAATDRHLYTLAKEWARRQPEEAAKWFDLTSERFTLTRAGWLVSDAIMDGILATKE